MDFHLRIKIVDCFHKLPENQLLSQIFVYLVMRLQIFSICFIFFCKLWKVWARLDKLNITHFTWVPLLNFGWINGGKKDQRGLYPPDPCKVQNLFNLAQTLHQTEKIVAKTINKHFAQKSMFQKVWKITLPIY